MGEEWAEDRLLKLAMAMGSTVTSKSYLAGMQSFVDLFSGQPGQSNRIIASLKCSRGGHYLTNQLLRKVFQNNENFSIIEIKEKNLPHSLINKTLLRSIA